MILPLSKPERCSMFPFRSTGGKAHYAVTNGKVAKTFYVEDTKCGSWNWGFGNIGTKSC